MKGRSDFHRHPPCPSARRQDLERQGTDHRYSLYSHDPKASDCRLYRQNESKWFSL
ncbi:hypothetical protein B0T26DRAFT_772815 [Lasiosphaeria miniovina]|uniref:Uncharacterized protein n=1 Tax=Lasiosphaeria miniovina TaxID=1954250 RepID=A0AA40E5K4_9PEZI|nr:uncharacterized protein B0T26DRAFT_772815 [Lasiosphaeria miniovina]KAK0723288.1 hypothetical protein B0T26DRAFT_772815 [Lasiosphaeria miniovina]